MMSAPTPAPASPLTMADDCRPRLSRGVRLKHDSVRDEKLLLAPERFLRLDAIAAAILEKCDGSATLADIADALAAVYAADRALILSDVKMLLAGLAQKRMVDFGKAAP